MLQYSNCVHLVLWSDIYSNSTTKEEKMCEKLLCCFMLPVETIALAGISTWQNPLISPHKTTTQGYYSYWVTLISLYCISYFLCNRSQIFCIALHFSPCTSDICMTNIIVLPFIMFVPTCYALTFTPLWKWTLFWAIGKEESDVVLPWIKPGGWFNSHSLTFCPSVCLWII